MVLDVHNGQLRLMQGGRLRASLGLSNSATATTTRTSTTTITATAATTERRNKNNIINDGLRLMTLEISKNTYEK